LSLWDPQLASQSRTHPQNVTMSGFMETYRQLFNPPKPKWTVRDIPDLSGKVALVTGGNSGEQGSDHLHLYEETHLSSQGIGKETVKVSH
jgi:hypothetical protein